MRVLLRVDGAIGFISSVWSPDWTQGQINHLLMTNRVQRHEFNAISGVRCWSSLYTPWHPCRSTCFCQLTHQTQIVRVHHSCMMAVFRCQTMTSWLLIRRRSNMAICNRPWNSVVLENLPVEVRRHFSTRSQAQGMEKLPGAQNSRPREATIERRRRLPWEVREPNLNLTMLPSLQTYGFGRTGSKKPHISWPSQGIEVRLRQCPFKAEWVAGSRYCNGEDFASMGINEARTQQRKFRATGVRKTVSRMINRWSWY